MNLRIYSHNVKYKGFSLIEVIVALALFALLGSGIATLIASSFSHTIRQMEITEARAYGMEGIDAVKSIQQRGWNQMRYNQSGIYINQNRWEFMGEGTQNIKNAFTRMIQFENVWRDGNLNIVTSATP